MARGQYLREVLIPILDQHLTPDIDEYSWGRYLAMKDLYGL